MEKNWGKDFIPEKTQEVCYTLIKKFGRAGYFGGSTLARGGDFYGEINLVGAWFGCC